MASQKPKPYTISWPFTPKTAEDIDQSLDILFKQVELNAPGAGVLPVSLGGTGLGSFVKGDLLYASTASTIAGLHDIATGNVLLSGGVNTPPSYGKVGLTTHVSGVLPEANGGTNQSAYSQGDLIYASAANTLAKLAKDTNATRYLSNTGASNAPAWAQVNLANGVTGTLPVANGGTNIASYTSGDLLYATGATTLAKLAIGAANRVLRSDGSAPNWGQVSDAYISDVTEAKITDGAILARVAANETITGSWIFSGTSITLEFDETDAGANERRWQIFVQNDAWQLRTINDAGTLVENAISIVRTGLTPTLMTLGTSTTIAGTCSATTFSGSGASLTSIPETAITDGTILARVAASETISGLWAFTNTNPTLFSGSITLANTRGYFIDNTAGSDIPIGRITAGNQLDIGSDDAAAMGNTVIGSGQAMLFRVNSAQRLSIGTGGDVLPAVDNAQTCGNASFRWSLVRGVTITPGDLLFENGWVITEADKYGITTPGLVILDTNDDIVAFIEDGGNIYANVLPLAALPAFVKTTLEQRTGHPRPTTPP
jgi:hypothetical protein